MTKLTRNAVRVGAVLAGLGPAALLGGCANDQAASPSTGSAAVTTPAVPASNADAMRRQGTGTVPGARAPPSGRGRAQHPVPQLRGRSGPAVPPTSSRAPEPLAPPGTSGVAAD